MVTKRPLIALLLYCAFASIARLSEATTLEAELSPPASVVVLTQARGASGVAGSLALHRLGPTGEWEVRRLPGQSPASGIITERNAEHLWLTVEDSLSPAGISSWQQVSISMAPFLVRTNTDHGVWQTAETRLVGSLSTPDGSPRLLAIGSRSELLNVAPDITIEIPIEGVVVASGLDTTGKLALVVSTGTSLRILDFDPYGRPRIDELDNPAKVDGSWHAAIVPTQDANRWLVVAHPVAASLEESAHCWVWLAETGSNQDGNHTRLEARGTISGDACLSMAGSTAIWLISHDEVSRFDYLTGWKRETASGSDTWEKAAEHLLSGIDNEAMISGCADGAVIVARARELSAWNGDGALWSRPLEEAASALVVTGTQAYVGVGNRFESYDIRTGERLDQVAFSTGHVASIKVIESPDLSRADVDLDGLLDGVEVRDLGTEPRKPDSDGDGTPDGADPEPRNTSPALDLPPYVRLSGRGAGTEVRALRVSSSESAAFEWEASIDDNARSWLRVYPLRGRGNTPVYLAIDPVGGRNEAIAPGILRITAHADEGNSAVALSPAEVNISVSASPRRVRRLLWLTPPGAQVVDIPQYETVLRDIVSGPPLYLSMSSHAGPWVDDLDDIDIVAMPIEAAALGLLSQRTVEEYLVHGGALLLLGNRLLASREDYLIQWGAPIGLYPDSTGNRWVLESGKRISNGAYSAEHAILGQGRLALVDSDSLSTTTSDSWEELRDSVDWLCQAGTHPQDLDADGLPDSIEDRNRNGALDQGETSLVDPDTDGDGVPDGIEDSNANGKTDPGETDPRNADTDGDDTPDGADSFPLPPFGTPTIDRLEPSEAPAEGRIAVDLFGQSLPQGGLYTIGGRRAEVMEWQSPERVRIIIPDAGSDTGGLAEVRVSTGPWNASGFLPDGFRYYARSSVRLLLEVDQGHETLDVAAIILRVEGDAGTPWRHASMVLGCSSSAGTWEVEGPIDNGGIQLAPLAEDGRVHVLLHRTGVENQGVVEARLRWHPGPEEVPRQGEEFTLSNVVILSETHGRLGLMDDSVLAATLVEGKSKD